MSDTLTRIQQIAGRGEVLISDHGYDELASDGILVADVLSGLTSASVVEDYRDAARGPTVLVLQMDANGRPVHVVWGVPKDWTGPAVLVTAYRPDPTRWSPDFITRIKR